MYVYKFFKFSTLGSISRYGNMSNSFLELDLISLLYKGVGSFFSVFGAKI